MKTKAAWKFALITGITMMVIGVYAAPLFKEEHDCFASQGQTVVKWKDQYWPCRHWWSIRCRHRHRTYKITLTEGMVVRDNNGMPIAMAGGQIKDWTVYDAAAWNEIGDNFRSRISFPEYEPIAENEYVVMVETRYWLFHNVEANLRLCTQNP